MWNPPWMTGSALGATFEEHQSFWPSTRNTMEMWLRELKRAPPDDQYVWKAVRAAEVLGQMHEQSRWLGKTEKDEYRKAAVEFGAILQARWGTSAY